MAYDPYEPAPPERDRWGLNLPLAVGVVVVFLIAVVTWVLIDATGDDEAAIGPTLPPPESTSTSTTVPPPTSTTPPLLPTTAPLVAPTAAPPGTNAPATPTIPITPASTTTVAPPAGATTTIAAVPPPPGDTVPGDLGVTGRPMQRPVCTGGYITVLGSNVASRTSAAGIQQLLERYPGSEYLRTDQSCRSLDRSAEGEPIYVVFLGPFPERSDACIARAQGPDGAYARQLSDEVGPDHGVACD